MDGRMMEVCMQQYGQMQEEKTFSERMIQGGSRVGKSIEQDKMLRALGQRPDNALLKSRVDEHMAMLAKEIQQERQKENVLFEQDEAFLKGYGPWDADNKALNPLGLGCLPKGYISEVNHNITLQYPNLNFTLDMGGPWKGCTLAVRTPDGYDFHVELDFSDPARMATYLTDMADWLRIMCNVPNAGEPIGCEVPRRESCGSQKIGRQADFVWPSADLRAPGEPEYQRELRKQQELQELNRKTHEELRRMLGE